jgi:hypothetical protein
MKTIIVPDVHTNLTFAELAVKDKQPGDHVIWIGDFFDDFGDNPEIAARTARWLEARTKMPDEDFLLGNHCAQYLWPRVQKLKCSGYAREKSFAIQAAMDIRRYRELVKLWVFVDGWWVSHAGFHRNFHLPVNDADLMRELELGVKKSLDADHMHGLVGAGFVRGGEQAYGGVTWLDFNGEFEPISGINQIVGHTNHGVKGPARNVIPDSDNWCLDARQSWFGVIEDGKLTVHKV